jgi:hypothetical protein
VIVITCDTDDERTLVLTIMELASVVAPERVQLRRNVAEGWGSGSAGSTGGGGGLGGSGSAGGSGVQPGYGAAGGGGAVR